ncbi:MAG: hypothetical protein IPG34_16485 [Rhodocyclaceae bacterium]|nr:hypothetical protein [Rhodocyclaceae bacterium]
MAGLSNTKGISAVRKKQYILLAGLTIVVAGVALLAGILGTPARKAPPQRPVETTRKAFGAQGEIQDAAGVWRAEEGARIANVQQDVSELRTKLAELQKLRDEEKKREEDASVRREAELKKNAELEAQKSKAPPPTALPGQVPLATLAGQPGGPVMPPQGPVVEPVRGIMRIDMGGASSGKNAYAQGKNAAGDVTAQPPRDPKAGPADVRSGQTADTYIPAGSFMRGLLLSGLDAPTGGQADQNPHPVIIEVIDMASLPNKFKADYKSCRITGNGAGDLSSERAYIRLDRMSCIDNNGGAIDIAVKGFVADSTGKAGIRGRLVSKQGQVLGNALLAGIASGMGQAFQQTAMTTATSPLGSTQTVDSGKEIQAGIGSGIGNAMNQLASYYIKMAEKLYPVIETDAGQAIDVVITQGISIARK